LGAPLVALREPQGKSVRQRGEFFTAAWNHSSVTPFIGK
jgi:hypothetical protein